MIRYTQWLAPTPRKVEYLAAQPNNARASATLFSRDGASTTRTHTFSSTHMRQSPISSGRATELLCYNVHYAVLIHRAFSPMFRHPTERSVSRSRQAGPLVGTGVRLKGSKERSLYRPSATA